MKNSKLAKLLVMLLSLTLLIGSAIGIAVSATGEDIIDNSGIIEAKTIIHNDKIQLGFYIDATADDLTNGTFTVEYYWGDEANVKNAVVRADGNRAGSTLVATEGVAYYELTKVATVTVKNAQGEEVDTAKYSVAQFLYAKLYADGFIDSADAGEVKAAAVYEALIDLGAKSQTYLNENPHALVSDCSIVYSNTDGLTVDGTNSYVFALPGQSISVTPVYTGETDITGYKLTGDTNLVFATGNSKYATGISELTLYTDTISSYLYDFEDTVTSGITFHTFTSASSKVPVTQTTVSADSTASAYYGTLGKLVTDPVSAANKVLSVVVNGSVNNTQTSNGGNISVIRFDATDRTENGTVHVLEYDFYLEHANKKFADPFELYAYDAEGNQVCSLQNYNTDSKYMGYIYFDKADSDTDNANVYHFGNGEARTSEASTIAQFDAKKWYRFRIIWNEADNSMRFDVSFDGGENWYAAFVGARTTKAPTGDVAYLGMQFNIYGIGYSCMFDNVTYEIVDTAPTVGGIANDSVEFPDGR